MDITSYQADLLVHALGRQRSKTSYRNYFAATPDSKDDLEWKDLVKKGYARLDSFPVDMFPYNLYVVTGEGNEVVEKYFQSRCFKGVL